LGKTGKLIVDVCLLATQLGFGTAYVVYIAHAGI